MSSQVVISPTLGNFTDVNSDATVTVTPLEKWPMHVRLAFFINALPGVAFVGLTLFSGWLFASMIVAGSSIDSDNGAGMAVAGAGFLALVILVLSLIPLSLITIFLVAAYKTKKMIFSVISMVLGSVSIVILSAIFISWLID